MTMADFHPAFLQLGVNRRNCCSPVQGHLTYHYGELLVIGPKR